MEKARKATQSAAYILLNKRPQGWAVERIRTKQKCWNLPGFPSIVAQGTLERLKIIGRRTPPRVHAAVFSTLFGRWLTAKRMGKWGHCRFNCGVGACDCAHYVSCPLFRKFIADNIDLRVAGAEAKQVFSLAQHPLDHVGDPCTLIKIALALFVAYRTFNAMRHASTLSEYETRRSLTQALVEATRGETSLMQLVARARAKRWGGTAPLVEPVVEQGPASSRRRLR